MKQADELMELARQYAHAYYNAYTGNHNGTLHDGMLHKTRERLRAALAAVLPPAAVQAWWIPVTERLPERVEGETASAPVLCYHPKGQHIDYCYYEYQHKDYDYGSPKKPGFAQPYTHWMPLPTGPAANVGTLTAGNQGGGA